MMDDGRLAEIHIDRGSAESFVGNVYIGRVVRVLPGMQAAFVDIGLERAAFLYAGDIYPAFAEKDEEIDIDEDADATIAEGISLHMSPRHAPLLVDVNGDPLLDADAVSRETARRRSLPPGSPARPQFRRRAAALRRRSV